eukprot:scaffold131860_cov28-Prasinocladus_malaysianus.AAC.1
MRARLLPLPLRCRPTRTPAGRSASRPTATSCCPPPRTAPSSPPTSPPDGPPPASSRPTQTPSIAWSAW